MIKDQKLPTVLLASASPRRRQLLEQIGVRFEVVTVDVLEQKLPAESPVAYVQRVALAKAAAGRALFKQDPRPVIGADTAVVLGDKVFGKPQNQADAFSMLRQLTNRTHQVLSAVAVVAGGASSVVLSHSEVTFGDLSDEEITAYWHTGEPVGKAGGYAIQGRAAAFIYHLSGSYSGVMGLPLYETVQLLQQIADESSIKSDKGD